MLPLLLLAGFGITHGMYELQRMLPIIEMRGIANTSPVPMTMRRMFLLPISFMFLFAFAIGLLIHEEFIARYLRASYFSVPLLLGLLVIFPAWSEFQPSVNWPCVWKVATRCFLAFPSGDSVLMCFVEVAGRVPVHERFRFGVSMYVLAVVLLIYGVLPGYWCSTGPGSKGSRNTAFRPHQSCWRLGLSCGQPYCVISYAFII